MVKSMYAAVAGLRAHQSKLDVISNNIANVNTWGYKSMSASFKESMYQKLSSGSAGSVTDGGYGATNPSMYGYGAMVSAISSNFTQGSPSPTDRGLDLYIEGPSFFMVGPIYGSGDSKNPNDCYLSRVGDFEVRNGYLVDSNGRYVYGCTMEKGSETHKIETNEYESGTLTETKDCSKPIGGITCDKVDSTGVNVGDTVTVDGVDRVILMIDGSDAYYATSDNVKYDKATNMFTYGNNTGELLDVKLNGGSLTANINVVPKVGDSYPDQDGFTGKVTKVEYDPVAKTTTISYQRVKNTNISYDGAAIDGMEFDTSTGSYKLGNPEGLKPIKIPTSCDYFDEETQSWKTENNVTLNSFSIDKNGMIQATSATTGKTYILGSVALVNVANPNGMTKSEGPYYKLTGSAGTATIVQAGGDSGKLNSGYLEMANVDIANEFSTMITAQRGFQANSKIITVTDEMLQELVNMKR